MNKKLLFLSALALSTFAGSSAEAYDSQCRNGNVRGSSMALSVCRMGPFAGNAKCADGLDAVRGTQWGEHTFITRQAMKIAGLGAFTDPAKAAIDPVLDYYTSGFTVPGTAVQSLEPMWSASMRKRTTVPITIPEFAQVPDMSYSLADFLLGNEHCLAENIPRGTLAQVQSCHSFSEHMGPVNSTHFPPQSRSIYNLYHGIALDRAARCKAIADAFPDDPGSPPSQLAAHVRDKVVPACEKEALVFEAVASHMLADAWSSGHMWERWGSPVFPDDTNLKQALVAVALTAGLIHGWRIVAEDTLGLTGKDASHDQLCLPGPWDASSSNYLDTVETTFAQPGQPGIARGGGDVYLLACTGYASNGSWGVASSPQLKSQYDRMMTCVARGFAEVYSAGPQTLGPINPTYPRPQIPSSQSDLCWTQRATNSAMYAAMGVTAFNDWGFHLSNVAIGAGVTYQTYQDGLIMGTAAAELSRYEAVKMRARAEVLAKSKPYGMEMATTALPTHVTWDKNSAYTYLIDGDQVAYFERHNPATWDSTTEGGNCASDANCPDHQYCRFGGKCVSMEGADLHVFRKAEIGTFCERDKQVNYGQAAATCTGMGAASDACKACVDLVRPHIRNACDVNSYAFTQSGADGTNQKFDARAPCEVLAAAGAAAADPNPIYLPYDPNDPTAADAAALKYCLAQAPAPSGSPISYDFDSPTQPPAQAIDIHAAQGAANSYTANRATCGANEGTHWFRFSHQAGTADKHVFKVTAKPLTQNGAQQIAGADRLIMTMYQGPACTSVISQTAYVEGGAAPDISLTWNIPENQAGDVCIKITTGDHQVWTGYDFNVSSVNEIAYNWAPNAIDPGNSSNSSTFNDASQTFPALDHVSGLRFSPSFAGYAHAHAGSCTHSVQLMSNGSWVTVFQTSLSNHAEHHYAGNDIPVNGLPNVTGIRFTSSPFQIWSYHSFGAGTFTLTYF